MEAEEAANKRDMVALNKKKFCGTCLKCSSGIVKSELCAFSLKCKNEKKYDKIEERGIDIENNKESGHFIFDNWSGLTLNLMQAIYFLLGNSNSDNYGSIQRIRDEQ